ncbi:sulfur carrier protein ThiS [uncultured Paludibaculum sp.]|uniref:sulfur carrier protein ThiS n=1 Tax=uncultured Paludibaculum sp. TaxID=1765020 RepID=UPI002AABE813|nr:sulfur carrier protein ThiS [uncultured Paludibaculum sp.]
MSNQPDGLQIPIKVNGEARIVPPGLNIRQLLAHLGLDSGRVAVELNRVIVRKPDWDSTSIETDASLEIVTFVGGGAA